MKHFRVFGMVFVFAAFLSGMALGQGLDDYLDLSGEDKDAGTTLETPVPVNRDEEHARLESWAGWMMNINVFSTTSSLGALWDGFSFNFGGHDRLRALKNQIEKLGVRVVEGGFDSHKFGKENYPGSEWTEGELEAALEVLQAVPEWFRKCTTQISRVQIAKDTDGNPLPRVEGQVNPNASSSVYLFDAAGNTGNPDYYKAVLIHEMFHCYQNQHPGEIDMWTRNFWTTPCTSSVYAVSNRAGGVVGFKNFTIDISGAHATAGGKIPIGSPVTEYGAKNPREDQAEAGAAFICSPALISGWPKRKEAIHAFLSAEGDNFPGFIANYPIGGWGHAECSPYCVQSPGTWFANWGTAESMAESAIQTLADACGFGPVMRIQ